ncbi:type I restriction-modification system, helicase subunits [Metamycoplasma equirhinis]|uniref:type I restriction endonuclease subunit R n=1 Tax=Metamycoplasma equirhinis TaxID=92402 RepID=UPI0025742E7A|nr:type I restriction endonuclease subunit R [Metamycoplasma equirhinis]BDX52401.1 type I restriction-modification system, helicase subunits [Metamycoplasma equirhinis]
MSNDIKDENSTIAEMTNGIIRASFQSSRKNESSYQSEKDLETQLIKKLVSQGYEQISLNSSKELFFNLRKQIEKLNNFSFTNSEWERFLAEYLNSPSDGVIEKTRKIQDNFIYDFVSDEGYIKNIKIIDKKDISNNYLQVVNQVAVDGKFKNRYDVTILVNGLPLVHIELKRRGVNLQEAFNQIHRYSNESFNNENSLYKFVQIFVISNGTYTKYFANTVAQDKNNYEFACEWADAKNKPITDLEDFTLTFLEKKVILEILTKYCIFDVNNTLLVMRPYQIAATERILWRIKANINEYRRTGKIQKGGYIWHTTGSGKTLTSFKTAKLATELNEIDKVFFIVDRKDLDYQTMKEYQKFQPDSVNGSKDTKELKKVIEKNDNKIIVTTIQKLNEFIKQNSYHEISKKQCIFIFDECHRSQFGEIQKRIRKMFKRCFQFGFTGTPIFAENALIEGNTTADIFGKQLHSYVITDAIRDGKVLKFMIDYNDTRPQFKAAEQENDDTKLKMLEKRELTNPMRISQIVKYIIDIFDKKTHRNSFLSIEQKRNNGFNAMFAVESIEAAKLYYKEFKRQQEDLPVEKRLKVATIFSYQQNEYIASHDGEIVEEGLESATNLIDKTSKEFLIDAINDYNNYFKTPKNFSIEDKGFQNYYRDLSQSVKNNEIDLVIVVGMLLTGFDAPKLNTLFVDKNLRYHGLIQAFSRTNRIFNKTKAFGNIVCFRDLEKATQDAIKIFGDENSANVILERAFIDYIKGFTNSEGKIFKGYEEIQKEIENKFPEPIKLKSEAEKKEFASLFGELLKIENILKNFDQFDNYEQKFSDRQMQDMKSIYIEIYENFQKEKESKIMEKNDLDFSDLEWQIEHLKTTEINLDYILKLIEEKLNTGNELDSFKEEIMRILRSSTATKSKEDLILEFMNQNELSNLSLKANFSDLFYNFAKEKKKIAIEKLIDEENLKEEQTILFIDGFIKKGYIKYAGDDLDQIIPPTSRFGGAREKKKEIVLEKINEIVQIFSGI